LVADNNRRLVNYLLTVVEQRMGYETPLIKTPEQFIDSGRCFCIWGRDEYAVSGLPCPGSDPTGESKPIVGRAVLKKIEINSLNHFKSLSGRRYIGSDTPLTEERVVQWPL
tara:strand:+ start:185 stop:517 length:333 start_codon:yes stop_codon:yes gene_type:complete